MIITIYGHITLDSTPYQAMIVLHDALLIGDAERVKNTVTAYHQVQQVLFTPTPTAL